MSIDDLARSAAEGQRASAATTFDVGGGLARIPGASRRRTVTQQATALVVIVLVLIAGGFAVRPRLGAVPEPVDSATATPSVTQSTSVPAPAGPFEALMVQGTTLVAIDAHGHERVVRDLAPLNISPADLEFAYVSNAGWLAIQPKGGPASAGIGHEFVNLLDPQARPVVVKGLFDQRTWSPDGKRLATNESEKGTVLIDAATGAKTVLDLQGHHLPGGGPSIIWTADGQGIVVADDTQFPGFTSSHLYVAPVDGGPVQSTVPELWERGRHSITVGGLQLDSASCFAPACPAGVVRVLDPSGASTTLYAGDLPGTKLAGATLSRDGRSAVLLLLTADPGRLELAQSDAGRHASVIATVPVSTTAGANVGISPDDSTLLVWTYTNPNSVSDVTVNYYVVTRDGSPSKAVQGSFAGWVPTSVIDQIAAAR